MGIAHEVVKAVGRTLHEVHAGANKLVSHRVGDLVAARLAVTSPAFAEGARLPISCTVDGDGLPPSITWTDVPSETRSIVVVCEDPDAPFPEPFVHWLVYGIDASVRAIDGQLSSGYRQGKNSRLKDGFTPAAPPPGHGLHHYHFQVFALDTRIDTDNGLGRGALLDRMRGHVLAWGEVVGTYERQ